MLLYDPPNPAPYRFSPRSQSCLPLVGLLSLFGGCHYQCLVQCVLERDAWLLIPE